MVFSRQTYSRILTIAWEFWEQKSQFFQMVSEILKQEKVSNLDLIYCKITDFYVTDSY